MRLTRRSAAQPVSPNTARLSRGKHRTASQGTCVMEVSTMLTGERFSDHPWTVCPLLATFLRSYNDHLPKRLRQNLMPWASDAVETKDARHAVLEDRRRRFAELADELAQHRRRRKMFDRCRCLFGDVAETGVLAARVVRKHPELQPLVDQRLREIYGLYELTAPLDIGDATPLRAQTRA